MPHGSQHIVLHRQEYVATTEVLQEIRGLIGRLADEFGFDDEKAYQIALAVDEACTNIIKHAYESSNSGRFTLEVAAIDDSFVITLTDAGGSFRFPEKNHPDLSRLIRKRRKGGLGLHIIDLVMDEVDYRTLADHTNRLVLSVRR